MINQIYELAKTVICASLRKNLILASFLIMLPLLLAAWLFEKYNPGFQSGFILDAGNGLMGLISIILLGVLSFEHLFWPVEQPTPWFYFSRIKNRVAFLAGKFIGISLVLGSALLDFGILLTALIHYTSGTWLIEPLIISLVTWAEYSLLLAVFLLFSTFLSKLMSVGLMIPVFFLGHSVPYIKEWLGKGILGFIGKAFLYIVPDLSAFDLALDSGKIMVLQGIVGYGVFMCIVYISIAGIILRHRDL